MIRLSAKEWGGVMLLAGTAVGAGMFGLSMQTGASGYGLAILTLLLAFSFMLLSLFVLLEANMYLSSWDANIISMAKARLGWWAQALAWLNFLLLLYAALAAYLSEGGGLMLGLWGQIAPLALQPPAEYAKFYGLFSFVFLFGTVVYLGTRVVDYFNRLFMMGLMAAFVTLIVFSMPHIQPAYLTEFYPQYVAASVPVAMASFTSHLILPTLRTYFENDLKVIKKVLIVGSLIPLALYLIWVTIIVGMLPLNGDVSLVSVMHSTHPVNGIVDALHVHVPGYIVGTAMSTFSFFAILTSFLAVALSLCDFLSDGFGISKDTQSKRVLLMLMTFVPPIVLLLLSSGSKTPIFILALGYLGVFIAVLYGILPALMVWKGRYYENIEAEYKAPGGKPALILLLVGSVAIIAFQIAFTLGVLPSP